MPVSRIHSPKARVTVTLSPDLIQQLDELLDSSDVKSRSRAMEEALRAWLRDQAREEIERQTEAYYHSLTKAERREDHQWSRLAGQSAKQLWDE